MEFHQEKLRTWSDLPQDILESIKKRLFFADQLTFHAVCKSWSSIDSFPPQKQMPWLIVLEKNYDKFNTWSSCKLVDPTSTKTFNIHMKAIKDFNIMKVHESKYGWLLISLYDKYNQISLFVYSPFYKEKNSLIELPDLHHSWSSLATFTCTSNPLEDDCLFLVVIALDNGIVIQTCRRRDKSWSSWDSYFPVGNQYVIWKLWTWMYSEEGIFYYIDDGYKTGTYDFARKKWSVIPPPPLSSSVPELPPLPYGQNLYIVKTDGEEELFLVYAPDLSRLFIRYIYRLDLSSMIWERVKSLGDNVLFIGDGYKSVFKLSEMKMKGISPDKVYYCSGSKMNCYSTTDHFLINQGISPDMVYYGSLPPTRRCCRKIFIDPPHHHH